MKILSRLFLSLTMIFTVASCSFDKNSNRDDRAEAENAEEFSRDYGPVFGVYQGTLSTTPVQRINIKIYPLEVPDGYTSDGQPRMKMLAKAVYRWLDSAQGDIALDVSYKPETGVIKMVREAAPAAPGAPPAPVEPFNIISTLSGEDMTGYVTRRQGKVGNINLHRISNNAEAPSEGDELERRERLRRLFQPFVGTYTGTVIFPGPQGERRPIDLRLYIIEKILDNGQIVLGLEGEYHRADDKYRDLLLTMAIEYRPETNPPSVVMVSYPYTRTPGGNSYKITITGTMVPGVIRANLRDHYQAKVGEVVLRRTKP